PMQGPGIRDLACDSGVAYFSLADPCEDPVPLVRELDCDGLAESTARTGDEDGGVGRIRPPGCPLAIRRACRGAQVIVTHVDAFTASSTTVCFSGRAGLCGTRELFGEGAAGAAPG